MIKTKLNSIFIDLDGVLNRWMVYEVSRRAGRCVQQNEWPPEFGWNIIGVVERLTGVRHTADAFWATVPEESWSEAPKSELFDFLVTRCPEIVGRENVHIVTSVPRDKNPVAYSGKAIWCNRHLPEWLADNVRMVTGKKHLLAASGRLLIDDADHNIEGWRAKGGETLLVPRPWNAAWKQTAAIAVRQELATYYG